METTRTARLAAAALCLAASPTWSASYKCLGPDGQVSYQQTPCQDASNGAELTPDTSRPSGSGARVKPTTVEAQIKALESAERKARLARNKEASAASSPSRPEPDEQDAARCAKQRAEAARWRREVKKGYRDRDERERQAQMLAHHEALIERYCQPKP